MAKKLIVGAIEGYTFTQIRPFFFSLRATGYQGDVVLFHRRTDSTTLDTLRKLGVHLIPIKQRGLRNPLTGQIHACDGRMAELLRLVPNAMRLMPFDREGRIHWMTGFAERFFHIANARFVLAYQFLKKNADHYSHAMISDIRDVCFQADPFDFARAEELCVFYEEPSFTLNRCQNYKEWIETAFGTEEVMRFGDERLSCCAITIGPTAAMLDYLGWMSRFMCENTTPEPYRFGLDSAVHNHLLFRDMLKPVTKCTNFHGSVLTMGGIPADALSPNHSGFLVNDDGSIINTLHQFDRHPSFKRAIEMKYSAMP